MNTRLQISAELVARWAEDVEASADAEEILYWKGRAALDRGDPETAETLFSAMRFVSIPGRVFAKLMATEARIAFRVAR